MKLKLLFYILPLWALLMIFSSCKDSSTEPVTSSAMTKISSYKTTGYSLDVVVYQQGSNYAFIADDNAGLQIINVQNPAMPFFTANYNTAGSASDVKVAGINNNTYAFVSDGSAGWDIINVSIPASPALDTVIYFPNENVICSFIETSTKRAYIGTYTKMYIYDISNLPNAVTQLSVYYSADNLNAIWAADGVAYLAQNTAGLELVNVTNPANPAYLSSFNTPGYALDVKLAGHYAYVADYTSMLVFDVVNPFNPVLAAPPFYHTDAQFNALAYSNSGIIYSAEGPIGVETIGVGNPSSPVALGYYNTGDYSSGIAVSGNYVYLADGNSGLIVLSYTTK